MVVSLPPPMLTTGYCSERHLFVYLFVNRITQKRLGWIFVTLGEKGILAREELIKFGKARIGLGLRL